MMRGIRAWLNSMQAHMILFAFGVIFVITALSFTIIEIAGPPKRSSMTVYDISRVIRGLAPANPNLPSEFDISTAAEAWETQREVERRLAGVLAQDLKMPTSAVRFYLQNRSIGYVAFVERQLDLYAKEGRASPVVHGTVVVALRERDGKWRLFERRSKDGFEDVWQLLEASPWFAGLLVIPFSMWFSTRISRPVRAFAKAVRRVGDSRNAYPVPVVGPSEIRVAAIALNDMQARIRDFLRERTALVGAIAHDLRTPLNNLRFRLASAPEGIRTAAEAEIRQLDRLINSTLDYVQTEGKPLSIDTIDLTALLQSLADDSSDRGRPVSLEADHVKVQGDILVLRRLFVNLIENALTYATRVTVTLSSVADKAVVEVRDNGPGMSPSDLPRAFEPFFRGERSRNRATGGIGLGLSIVKFAAEAHCGAIALENLPEGGLVARVTLPVRQSGSGT